MELSMICTEETGYTKCGSEVRLSLKLVVCSWSCYNCTKTPVI